MRGPSSINTYIIMIIDTKYFYTIIIIYISLYDMVYIYIYIVYMFYYFNICFLPLCACVQIQSLPVARWTQKDSLLYIPNPDCTHKYEVEVSSSSIMVYRWEMGRLSLTL